MELLVVKPHARDQSNKELEKTQVTDSQNLQVLESTPITFPPNCPHQAQ
jgi:hypothetical protein